MTPMEFAPISADKVNTVYQVSAKKTSQASHAERTSQQSDKIELSSQARARSLKQDGNSVNVISMQMGVDVKTVQQYLGIGETVAAKASTVPPKPGRNDAAEARLLKQEGYSATMIATRMGAELKAVDQYLQPGELSKASVNVQPKKLYSEPVLTTAAEAKALKQEGFSIAMIASQMGVTVESVKQYLGVI